RGVPFGRAPLGRSQPEPAPAGAAASARLGLPLALTRLSLPLAPTRLGLPLAPTRRRGCCGSGCAGCPYGDWVRRVRALGAPAPASGT
ncbi:MAG: hypothetical protein K1X94_23230, partial [Sandaracinaceae bacterium]|nr:hypothetical protein [Sandaracinaceae bacterium]